MAKILFIGAMREEIEQLVLKLKAELNEYNDEMAEVGGNMVYITVCGVGKVNAAASIQRATMLYQPDFVINIGIAGMLSREYPLCTVVLCKTSCYHDFSPDWVLEKYPPYTNVFRAGEQLFELAKEAAKRNPDTVKNCVEGCVVTGDSIISEAAICNMLHEKHGADCVDMETAAIAHVCLINKIPFLAIRSMSDFADEDALPEMERQSNRAVAAVTAIAIDMIHHIR